MWAPPADCRLLVPSGQMAGAAAAQASQATPYLVGADITGEPGEVGFMGYGRAEGVACILVSMLAPLLLLTVPAVSVTSSWWMLSLAGSLRDELVKQHPRRVWI